MLFCGGNTASRALRLDRDRNAFDGALAPRLLFLMMNPLEFLTGKLWTRR